MSIFINEKTPVLVQGITGRIGSFHAQEMIDYGTNVVAGVTPGKGGTTHLGKPVFNTVKDAVEAQVQKLVLSLFHLLMQLMALWRRQNQALSFVSVLRMVFLLMT